MNRNRRTSMTLDRRSYNTNCRIFYKVWIVTVAIACLSVAIICISLLKERSDKMQELNFQYQQVEKSYHNLIPQFEYECKSKSKTEQDCKIFNDTKTGVGDIERQIIKLKAIDNRGASESFCGSLSAITSGVRGFENTCYTYENCMAEKNNNVNACIPKKDTDKNEKNEDFFVLYSEIKNKFGYSVFDYLPSQILYLLLVMSSSLIGTMYRLKDSFCFIKTQHILVAFFQGFIAYAMSVGAEFVVVLGNHQVLTAVNPYSVSLIGCFAGMFFEKFFNSVLNQKNHSKKYSSPHPFTLP